MTSSPLELPDLPRWVEAHGIAAAPGSWRRPHGDGLALGHPPSKLIVVTSDADASALAREHPGETIIGPTLRIDRPRVRAILHTLPEPDELPDLEGAARLPADVPLPPTLAAELALARDRIWAAWVDGEPVAFAYAPWRSAAWFDVSVDTLPGARQLGLGTLVAAAMIRDERAQGREPVWGADEDNHASLRLARRLGFVPHDELWVSPP